MDRTGCTRVVFLVGRWAFKVPNFFEWRLFLKGLLANMMERLMWRNLSADFQGLKCLDGVPLCPVKFSLPGGWLVVMPRVRVLTDEEYEAPVHVRLKKAQFVEQKSLSFGWWFDGETERIYAIDYGN